MGLRPDLEGQRILRKEKDDFVLYLVLDGVAREVQGDETNLRGNLFGDDDHLSPGKAGPFDVGFPLLGSFLASDEFGDVYLAYSDGIGGAGMPPLYCTALRKRWVSSPDAMARYHFGWDKVVNMAIQQEYVGLQYGAAMMLMGLPMATPPTIDAVSAAQAEMARRLREVQAAHPHKR